MEEKKITKERALHFRFFWLTVLVMGCSLLVQLVVSIVGSAGISAIAAFQAATEGITDLNEVTELCTELVYEKMGFLVMLSHVCLILVFGLWYGLGMRRVRQRTPLKQVFSPKNIGVTVLLAVSLCFFTNFMMELLMPVIPSGVLESYMELLETTGMGEDVFTIIAAVCLAPIGEELIYRGVILYYAQKFTAGIKNKEAAFWIANALQALWFGVFHGNLLQGSYAFFLGMGLGYLAKRYHSILPAMLAHCIINTCSSFLWGAVYYALPQQMPVYAAAALVFALLVGLALKLGGSPLKEEAGKH